MGDFNAHTGNQSEALPHIHPDILSQFDAEPQRANPPQGISRDHPQWLTILKATSPMKWATHAAS